MLIENSFIVPVTAAEAWEVLLDLPRVVPCLPGAALDSADGDEFTGRVKVKLGPIQLTYAGTGRFVERDATARRAVIEGAGKDVKGASTAKALVTATLQEKGKQTEVKVVTDFTVTGKPAQFGRGIMQDVSAKLLEQFSANLSTQLTQDPAAKPGGSPSSSQGSSQTTAAVSPENTTPATSSAPPAAATSTPQGGADDALDLMQIAGPALTKRLALAAATAMLLVTILFALRRRAHQVTD